MQLLQATTQAVSTAATAVAIEITPAMMLTLGLFIASFAWGWFVWWLTRNDKGHEQITDVLVTLGTMKTDITNIKEDVRYLKEKR